jgi:hypothetical protein
VGHHDPNGDIDMNTLMKVGLSLVVVAGALGAAHVAHSTEPAQAPAAALVLPASLEAEIRAMARAHAMPGQNVAEAEAYVMKLAQAHLAEVARDPAHAAHAREVMAKAAAGDQAARQQIHTMLISLIEGAH